MKARLMAIAIAGSLAGCTIVQEVQPVTVSTTGPREICIVTNPAVRQSFLDAYADALKQKGFTVRMLPAGAGVSACPLTSTYTASWHWDLAMYLTYVSFKVYRDNRLEGEALYDSTNGGANTKKFIDANKKVLELTNKLFPG